jgi:hypothetical protein
LNLPCVSLNGRARLCSQLPPEIVAQLFPVKRIVGHARQQRVFMPNYLSRFRGMRQVGDWLERWLAETLPPDDLLYVFAFILGGAALPYAPTLVRRARRIVLLRSRYQEGVPRLLRRRLRAWPTAALFGRAVADLGHGEFWPPGFSLPCPHTTVVETVPTPLARWLRIRELSDDELGIAGYSELPIDHNSAYGSPELMQFVTDWLKARDD